ncbi:hypothetical protein AA637_13040 [Cyanobacterium sp. HL-69]|uniref:hypothetical protein n=1 Tax=Cyanobacterium sp. HL-69 TaxID=2054282 RepID=UPI000CA13FD3|nr:hypothetical protein AA637_13040 [Cyanobacterium sp. HL-69]
MEILSLEHLQTHGVKAEEIQKGLKIKCFGKSFLRKSDVPKRFREKALFLSAELLSKGEESFVTETKFSYTVWMEEKVEVMGKKFVPSKQVNSENNRVINDNNNSQKFSSQNFRASNKKIVNNTNREEHIMSASITELENNVQWNISVRDKNSPTTTTPSSPPQRKVQSYETYRGAAFIHEEKEESITKIKKKPKTYRGQVY